MDCYTKGSAFFSTSIWGGSHAIWQAYWNVLLIKLVLNKWTFVDNTTGTDDSSMSDLLWEILSPFRIAIFQFLSLNSHISYCPMMHVEVLLGHSKAEDRKSFAMQLDVVERVFTQTFMGTCFVPKSSLGWKYTSEFNWLFFIVSMSWLVAAWQDMKEVAESPHLFSFVVPGAKK